MAIRKSNYDLKYFDLLQEDKDMVLNSFPEGDILITKEELEKKLSSRSLKMHSVNYALKLIREIIIEKKIVPIIRLTYENIDKNFREEIELSWMSNFLHKTYRCYENGLDYVTVNMCRTTLEISLRESLSILISNNELSKLIEEYKGLEYYPLSKLITKAEDVGILDKGLVEKLFSVNATLDYPFIKILDKFVHGGYSDLFFLIAHIDFPEVGKSNGFLDYFFKTSEIFDLPGIPKSMSRNLYISIIEDRRLSFYILEATTKIFANIVNNLNRLLKKELH